MSTQIYRDLEQRKRRVAATETRHPDGKDTIMTIWHISEAGGFGTSRAGGPPDLRPHTARRIRHELRCGIVGGPGTTPSPSTPRRHPMSASIQTFTASQQVTPPQYLPYAHYPTTPKEEA